MGCFDGPLPILVPKPRSSNTHHDADNEAHQTIAPAYARSTPERGKVKRSHKDTSTSPHSSIKVHSMNDQTGQGLSMLNFQSLYCASMCSRGPLRNSRFASHASRFESWNSALVHDPSGFVGL
ncbi:hypothetical protein NW768_000416 [Fusarium equiseti]|uniref:Uncharacterized protein n=1 Tax=Fusarium equiseti TaxID=61235 RepID=A0ABQ8RSG0_FUSEQ|nr:hypothetical protein NW768_000416 [Fusarium equiseti]